MKLIYFALLLLSLTACMVPASKNNSVESQKNIDNNGSKILIPKNVTDYIKNNIKGWSIPDTSDYIKAWWSFYEKYQTPYFVTTDLNDDKNADYAFILKRANTIQLFILIAKGTSFIYWTADNFKITYSDKVKDIQFGLTVERPGRIDCVVDGKECALDLTSNGITLMALEKKCIVYYLYNGKINSFIEVTDLSYYTVK